MGVVVNEGKMGVSRLGTVLDGRYRIDTLVRRGRLSTVYRGQHLSLGRAIAVKVMGPEDLGEDVEAASRRFYESAAAAAQLTHPANVTVLDFGEAKDGALYVVMEFVEGRPLSEILRQQGPLSTTRAVALVQQVCRALTEAHSRNFIHRDVKSSNIVVSAVPRAGVPKDGVKLIDFALARRLDEGDEVKATSDSAANLGSSLYVAPEQVLGEAEDVRTDIYGVGVVLYEALTGRTPFRGRTQVETLLAHVQSAPPPMRREDGVAIPEALVRIVLRCLAKQKSDRFASMSEVLEALSPFSTEKMEGAVSFDIEIDVSEASVGASASTSGSVVGETKGSAASSGEPRNARAFDSLRRPVAPVATYRVGAGLPLATAGVRRRGRVVALVPILVGMAVGGLFFLRSAPNGVATDVMAVTATEGADGTAAQVTLARGLDSEAHASAAERAAADGSEDEPMHSVILTFRTDPAGATVYSGKDIYGPTPAAVQWVGKRARPGQTHTFRIEREGYLTEQVTRTLGEVDLEVRVTLQVDERSEANARRRAGERARDRRGRAMPPKAAVEPEEAASAMTKAVSPEDDALRRALEALDRSQTHYRGAAKTKDVQSSTLPSE